MAALQNQKKICDQNLLQQLSICINYTFFFCVLFLFKDELEHIFFFQICSKTVLNLPTQILYSMQQQTEILMWDSIKR